MVGAVRSKRSGESRLGEAADITSDGRHGPFQQQKLSFA
jgi:hypothetical protein